MDVDVNGLGADAEQIGYLRGGPLLDMAQVGRDALVAGQDRDAVADLARRQPRKRRAVRRGGANDLGVSDYSFTALSTGCLARPFVATE